uniref:Uncharacterized protein n=1 Tax=Coccidioides posadasii RMSCC 3488 TaxID=454284 RepID=A0A0J6FTJ2_COCPO|nr:hypothetical protein CPAG_08994 [Coccidioides posadasii RMSCC 3488]
MPQAQQTAAVDITCFVLHPLRSTPICSGMPASTHIAGCPFSALYQFAIAAWKLLTSRVKLELEAVAGERIASAKKQGGRRRHYIKFRDADFIVKYPQDLAILKFNGLAGA